MVCWFSSFWRHFDWVKRVKFGVSAGISWRLHGGNGLKFCMLLYPHHLQNWLVYSLGLLIFKFWHFFDLVKQVKFGVSGHFLENSWREWSEILHACVSWPPSELIRVWSWSVDFSNFGTILSQWNGSNLGVLVSSWRTHWGNGLTFCILMYPDHLLNWLDNDHSLLIFLILTLMILT